MHKFIIALLVLAVTDCKSQNINSVSDVTGAYLMLSQTLKGRSVDTTFTEHKQMKIYTEYYMMYVRINPADSVSAFGIGTFSIKRGKLTEHIFYSANDTVENTNSFSGEVNFSKRNKSYEQVIPEIRYNSVLVQLTEDYESIGINMRSPLDGTWKQTAAYTVHEKDTINAVAKKYKTYYRGNFATGSFSSSSSGSKHTIAEYGTFIMNGKNRVKESIAYSTFSARKGQSDNADIIMEGNDAFTETVTDNAGSKQVERYVRLK